MRVGGPNAGHTVFFNDKIYTLKTIPSGFVNPDSKLILAAGAYIITDWLLKEIELTGTENRLIIDPHAVIIEPRHTEAERKDPRMMQKVGSVGTGLGEAVRERIDRKDEIKFAKDEPLLSKFIQDAPETMNSALADGQDILLEGTQGMKLSLLHGEYPFVTSRDTTASTFMGEAGLGPKYVRDVYCVFKPYVTRTGPGPLESENKDSQSLKKYHTEGREVGSVSGRLRRIGGFETETAKRAVIINSATKLAITHIDLLGADKTAKNTEQFPPLAREFIEKIKDLGKIHPNPKLSLISTGPGLLDVIDLR